MEKAKMAQLGGFKAAVAAAVAAVQARKVPAVTMAAAVAALILLTAMSLNLQEQGGTVQ